MQLVRLQVTKGAQLLRDIPFTEGVNIITNSGEGNQIGKSTTLRAINFCLGSDGKNIWLDPDRKIENPKVKRFVIDEEVKFSLELNLRGTKHTIQREFIEVQQKNRKILKVHSKINGREIVGQDQFVHEIASIFGHHAEKPTFNSLKSRFVRIEKTTVNQLYKYLSIFTSNDEYLALYSHLFGYAGHENLSKELNLKKEIKQIRERISALLNGATENSLTELLRSVDDELEILQAKEERFDFKGAQTAAIKRLKNHRIQIAELSSYVAQLETKALYSNRTLENYRSKISDVDVSQVSAVYKEAKSLIPDLSKSLSDTIDFHNSILKSKIDYVEQQASTLHSELSDCQAELNDLLDSEKPLIRAVANESHFGGFLILEQEIRGKREERGRISFVLDEIAADRKDISSKERAINRLRGANEEFLTLLKRRVDVFNQESKALTRALFKTFGIYLDVASNDKGELEFKVVNENKITGDGAPRAAALAFDMAFVEYVKKTGAKLPEFTVQDYLEPADEDKLAKLAHLANDNETQVVMSLLSDKLHLLDPKFKEENIVLTLSQSDKFFQLP